MKIQDITEAEGTNIKFQRKHFEFIADTFGRAMKNSAITKTKVIKVVDELMVEFKKTNPMFKEEIFKKRILKAFRTKAEADSDDDQD